MPRAAPRDPIYHGRRYSPEVIELCVRWYLTYRLSYRDLSAMMAERDVAVSHTTIMRWVQRYVPEFERRWARFSRPTKSSWRMDETAVSVQGQWQYLYRAVDRHGKSIHSLLCEDRTVESAQEFFRQAVKVAGSRWPEKVNLDGNAASHRGLRLLGDEDSRWQSVRVRARRYLNNIVEQDHRAIKQRCAPMLGLKSFRTIRRSHPYVRPHRARRSVVRYPRKVSFGQNLYLLVTPKGGRCWRYRYRFQGREKLISLGCYPDVPMESAWARHQAARQLLALGLDPAGQRKALRQISARRV